MWPRWQSEVTRWATFSFSMVRPPVLIASTKSCLSHFNGNRTVGDLEASSISEAGSLRSTCGEKAPKTVQMKIFSSKNLLSYMIPDRFVFLEEMPKTSTDKIDLQRLKILAQ